ncbi:MAG TPA: oxygenase MpaB family protein [Acidimicrobiales bacterium]|nr:oxygenase MpaB family protein [Acidimicrobiales bacterium]
MSIETLRDRVRRQATELPAMYGDIDFDAVPERLALEPGAATDLPPQVKVTREELFADTELIDLMATATMLGDIVCDSYVARMGDYGMQELIRMVVTACSDGLDAVEDAPDELVAFIESMEAVPDWIDMDLIEEGARSERVVAALASPYAIRGAFLATFLNEYAALPMAVTGSLSDKRAAQRVNETAMFFASTVLPGGMRRDGPGFHAAAMVRLMHSMVRYNVLTKAKWDRARFGIPIPQVDQMPAGLIGAFLLSAEVVRSGRDDYNDDERAQIELSRYRCHLLGLPEELLPTDPNKMVNVFLARAATLRKGFDDETCGELVRSTMAAYLRPDHSIPNRIAESIERAFSTAFFIKVFLDGDEQRAAEMGVTMSSGDKLRVAASAPLIFGRLKAVQLLNKVPPLRPVTDAAVTWTLRQRLKGYGQANFRTDAASYTHGKRTSKHDSAHETDRAPAEVATA